MQQLQPMIDASKPDELMIIGAIYDHEARKKSYSLLADAFGLEGGGGQCDVVIPGDAKQTGLSKFGSVLAPGTQYPSSR